MNSTELKAVYNLGFYYSAILPGVNLICGEFGMNESYTEILKGISPLKGCIKRLIFDENGKILICKLDQVYEFVKNLKIGDVDTNQTAIAIFNTIEDLCMEVEQAILEFRDSTLSGRAMFLFESGRLLSVWHNLLKPPYKLSDDAFKTLIMNMKAANLDAPSIFANNINKQIEDNEWAQSEVWSLHNNILKQLNHEAFQEFTSIGGETLTKSHLTGLKDLEQFDKDSVLIFENPTIPVSLVFVDMDNLKNLNSEIGHDAADEVIKQFAILIENATNFRGTVYHRSGDEFLVVLKNTTANEALLLLDRIVCLVKNEEFNIAVGKVKITMSGGIATYPDHAKTLEDLKKQANEAMKAAKTAGKSCIKIAKIP